MKSRNERAQSIQEDFQYIRLRASSGDPLVKDRAKILAEIDFGSGVSLANCFKMYLGMLRMIDKIKKNLSKNS